MDFVWYLQMASKQSKGDIIDRELASAQAERRSPDQTNTFI